MGRWILSGNKIDESVTPIYTRDGNGGGSFQSDIFVFRDQTITYTGSASLRVEMKVQSSDGQLWRIIDGLVSEEVIPTLPLQWQTNAPSAPPLGSATYAVRRTVDSGPNLLNEDPNGLGNWGRLTTSMRYGLWRPSSGVVENTSTYEFAKWADTSEVLARANVTLRYTKI